MRNNIFLNIIKIFIILIIVIILLIILKKIKDIFYLKKINSFIIELQIYKNDFNKFIDKNDKLFGNVENEKEFGKCLGFFCKKKNSINSFTEIFSEKIVDNKNKIASKIYKNIFYTNFISIKDNEFSYKYYFSNLKFNSILLEISTFNDCNSNTNIQNKDVENIDLKIDDGKIYQGIFRGEAYYKKNSIKCKISDFCSKIIQLEPNKNYYNLIINNKNSWIEKIYYQLY